MNNSAETIQSHLFKHHPLITHSRNNNYKKRNDFKCKWRSHEWQNCHQIDMVWSSAKLTFIYTTYEEFHRLKEDKKANLQVKFASTARLPSFQNFDEIRRKEFSFKIAEILLEMIIFRCHMIDKYMWNGIDPFMCTLAHVVPQDPSKTDWRDGGEPNILEQPSKWTEPMGFPKIRPSRPT